ncbi:MAG: hypothetical protein E6J83_11540, partial [Deltaproteobacteria bacterium]
MVVGSVSGSVTVGSVIAGSVSVVVDSGGSVRVVVLLVVVVDVVVEGRVVVVLVDVVDVVVEGRVVVVVVVVVAGSVVDVVEVERKVASNMNQLVAVPRVRLPCCGPAALDRMSSTSEEALPFRTSRTYGTIWLLPG